MSPVFAADRGHQPFCVYPFTRHTSPGPAASAADGSDRCRATVVDRSDEGICVTAGLRFPSVSLRDTSSNKGCRLSRKQATDKLSAWSKQHARSTTSSNSSVSDVWLGLVFEAKLSGATFFQTEGGSDTERKQEEEWVPPVPDRFDGPST